MRVVFDSNILISALVFPGRQAEKAVFRIIEGRDYLLVSRPIINEVLAVLARKFGRDGEELARVAVLLAEVGQVVTPRQRLHLLADDADNRILECAVAGRASILVTGDRAMLEVGSFRGVRIVSLRAYLEMK
ncbi:MAG TPA: putative toxin-antitoxin system toxin component, PIN family [Candidatus Binataceae bacterium]|nr:putative toxin-antitoxin system toxin component, PIN family [Candidatus Binataceae bacterium]